MTEFYPDDIWAYYCSEFKQGEFVGTDGLRLRYVCSTRVHSENAMIVLGGRTECVEKYAELFHDLRDLDCCFYSYDHRGQGLSERMLEDKKKGHVVKFSDYSEDLRTFMDTVVRKAGHKKIILLGHSMGCAVIADYLLGVNARGDGVIFCSPMFDIITSPVPKFIARIVVALTVVLGFGEEYIWGGSYFSPSELFNKNRVTSSERRFNISRELLTRNPELDLGGATFSWVNEAFQKMTEIVSRAAEFEVPILLLQSGDDQVVDQPAQDMFCCKNQFCTKVTIDGGMHELLMERDQFRNQAVTRIHQFCLQHLGES